MRVAQGDLPGALQAFTESKNIADKLAAADPGNAEWQRDLIVSHWKLADLLERMPDRAAEAAGHWSQALAIARNLAATGRLAPTDAYFVETLEQRLAAAPTAPGPATLTRQGSHPPPSPDRRPRRAHPFPPASPPPASSGSQAPARPRSARAPGSARPLVHPPDDNPKIANDGLTRHLTGPALPMIIAG